MRSSAATARALTGTSAPIALARSDRRAAGAPAARRARARSPSARSASASPPAGSWLVDHARAPATRAPISGSTSVGGGGVEVRARLVEQQQLGVVQHRAADREPLHHPARVACARGRRRAGAGRRARAAPRRASTPTPCRRAWKRRFSRRGEVAVQQRLVRRAARRARARPSRRRGSALAEHARDAGVRAQQRREHAQQRRLAGAVGAEDDERRARRDRQRDVVRAPTRSP